MPRTLTPAEETAVGTYQWEADAAACFHESNGVDISQVAPFWGARDWLWECERGHQWSESASSRNKTEKLTVWRAVHARLSCRYCVMDDHGPVYRCGHPRGKEIGEKGRLMQSTYTPRVVVRFDCLACTEAGGGLFACGKRADEETGGAEAAGERGCRACVESLRLLGESPELQERVDSTGITLATAHTKRTLHCGTPGHASFEVDLYGIARGYWCKTCWKSRQTKGWKLAAGTAFTDGRQHPGSKLENDVRLRLAEHFPVAKAGGVNSVALDGDLYGRGEANPDILIPKLRIAVEVDSPGRDGAGHTGKREEADRLKDLALRAAGWRVVRLRLAGLGQLDTADANVCTTSGGATRAAVAELVRAIEKLGTA